jgi:hypothetical protein
MQAWQVLLRADLQDGDGDESKAFVQQRLEQVPQAMGEETLEQQVALTLQALLRSEDEVEARAETDATATSGVTDATAASGDSNGASVAEEALQSQMLPYWFLPTDWARLSEAYQVDFVLHGLPGTESCKCEHCDCSGHVHVGAKSPGIDVSLHVGWRGARSNKEGDAAWGHWEPLGSGPIKPSISRQDGTVDSDLDLSNALKAEPTGGSFPAIDEERTQCNWALAGLCARVCEPQRQRKPCPKLKDCCDSERRVSDDSVGDHSKTLNAKVIARHRQDELGSAEPANATSSGRLFGSGAGARFSVLVEGKNLFEGLDLEDNAPLRQADAAAGGCAGVVELERFKKVFVEAVSKASGIAESRVHILNIGLPLETRMQRRAARLAATAPKEVVSQESGKATTVSPLMEPDTGAGVLRFLTDGNEAPVADSAVSPAPDAATTPSTTNSTPSSPPPGTPLPRGAPTPWQTPMNDDFSTPPPLDRTSDARSDASSEEKTQAKGSPTGTTVVRVLAVLREPLSSGPLTEPDAMMALELVVTELADPKSALQEALKGSLDERINRIWCPEAEGARKGPHRTSAVVRSRQAAALGKAARLRQRMG